MGIRKLAILILLAFLPFYVMSQDAITHTVGEKLGGGIVFYVTPNGQHGLISESQDQLRGISFRITVVKEWTFLLGNPEYLSDDAKNYTDWRLPYPSELDKMYANRSIIGGFDDSNYFGGQDPQTMAYFLSFKDGKVKNGAFQSHVNVRLVRSF